MTLKRRQWLSDDDDVTNDGRLFHAWAAATGKARSPIVLRRVAGTMTADDELERSLRLVSTSATDWCCRQGTLDIRELLNTEPYRQGWFPAGTPGIGVLKVILTVGTALKPALGGLYKKHPVCTKKSPIWDPKSKIFFWGGTQPCTPPPFANPGAPTV